MAVRSLCLAAVLPAVASRRGLWPTPAPSRHNPLWLGLEAWLLVRGLTRNTACAPLLVLLTV